MITPIKNVIFLPNIKLIVSKVVYHNYESNNI